MPAPPLPPLRQGMVAVGLVAVLGAGLAVQAWQPELGERAGAHRPAPATSSVDRHAVRDRAGKPASSRNARTTAEPSVGVARSACGAQGSRVVAFRVEIDRGLRSTAEAFARSVRAVLCDSRGWRRSNVVRFRYDPAGSLLVGLRTPDESERRCLRLVRLTVRRRYSCGTPREIVINSDRWFKGVAHFDSLTVYRRMLVNHEVGHALGLRHSNCELAGDRAPVMMQQSKGLRSSNGRTCAANPWPLDAEIDRLQEIWGDG